MYIGKKLLLAQNWLPDGAKLVAGGCFPDNETYIISKLGIEPLPELKCNHEEADTRLFAHAVWSKKKEVELVASDTDIMAIFLLNHQHFTQRQVVLHYGNVRSKLDLSKLVKAMNEDSNTNLAILRNKGVDTPTIFGIIHPLIGSDILCSPRGFGPSWILKTCLDYATYLFDQESGIQLLGKDDPKAKGAYIRFIIALFKKKYSSKIKATPEELLRPLDDYSQQISEIQKQTWAHTIESKSMLPSKECLELREQNLAFQLQIWMNATFPTILVPDPSMYGWEKVDGEYELKADSDENTKKQRGIFDAIMRKYGCKSSRCLSNRCSCRKNGNAFFLLPSVAA